jgi:endonuclease YncB( thermonuclease family)
MPRLWIALLLCITAPCAWAAGRYGRVVRVNAGNRLEVMQDGRREHIRLYGVDCPTGEAGVQAQTYMRQLALQRGVHVSPIGPDQSGSVIAKVSFVGGKSLNREMVESGMARWCQKTAPKDHYYARLESDARLHRRGLWSAGRTSASSKPPAGAVPKTVGKRSTKPSIAGGASTASWTADRRLGS